MKPSEWREQFEPPPPDFPEIDRPTITGGELTARDISSLQARWITPEIARRAQLRRVDDQLGAALVGRTKGNYAGIGIPYFRPGEERPHEWRIRRDKPDVDVNGKLLGKYMAPPGRGNMVYYPPGFELSGLPIVITEGEFKTLALSRLPGYLPIGLSGVWNWRGTIGKANGSNGERLDVKGVIPDLETIPWDGRSVILAFDADAEKNESVDWARKMLSRELRARGALVAIVTWDIAKGKGVDDLLAAVGPDEVVAMFAAAKYLGRESTAEGKAAAKNHLQEQVDAIICAGDVEACYAPDFIEMVANARQPEFLEVKDKLRKAFKDFSAERFRALWKDAARQPRKPVGGDSLWEVKLLANDKGALKSCYENVALFLENHADWKGVLGYNEFTGGHDILANPPDPITARLGQEIEDHFDTEVTRWFERQHLMIKPDMARRSVDASARANSFHPVRQYLEALPPWDGVDRADRWLFEYCGADASDRKKSRYIMAAGDKFLISAVARIMEPGCKADYLLVLEGPQRTGKSTVVSTLASDDWFTDQLSDIGSKDASMQLRGVWIVEFGELDAFARVDMSRLKAFLSAQSERFRLPYGKRIVKHLRQCVFIGTTNLYNWNKDHTGAGRFWPVRTRKIDIPALLRDRDQLWAEAFMKYRRGDRWFIDDVEILKQAKRQQTERYDPEVWRDKIRDKIFAVQSVAAAQGCEENSVSVAELMAAIGMDSPKQDQIGSNRVARCLIADGWEQYRDSAGGRPWRYRKVTEPEDDVEDDD